MLKFIIWYVDHSYFWWQGIVLRDELDSNLENMIFSTDKRGKFCKMQNVNHRVLHRPCRYSRYNRSKGSNKEYKRFMIFILVRKMLSQLLREVRHDIIFFHHSYDQKCHVTYYILFGRKVIKVMKKLSHDINLARENLTTAMTRTET